MDGKAGRIGALGPGDLVRVDGPGFTQGFEWLPASRVVEIDEERYRCLVEAWAELDLVSPDLYPSD